MRRLYVLAILFVLLNVALAVAQQPSQFARAYLDRGNARIAKGDLDGGIVDFGTALKFDPGYAEAYYERGRAFLGKADLDSAISDFSRAVEINPRFV